MSTIMDRVTRGTFSLSACAISAVMSKRDTSWEAWDALVSCCGLTLNWPIQSPNSSCSQAACLQVQAPKHMFVSWWDLGQLEGKPELIQMPSTGSATFTLQCGLAGHQPPTRLHPLLPRASKGCSMANGKQANWPGYSTEVLCYNTI